MTTYLHAIETFLPENAYSQIEAGKKMAEWTRDKKAKRYISKIYEDSGIETRYSVIPDMTSATPKYFHSLDESGDIIEPGTAARNDIFIHESKKLFVNAAGGVLARCPEVDKSKITHLITVSCTGFYNPGPDLHIIESLKLPQNIERYNIGFMGCYGAFPALRMAKQFCEANTDAVVLVVCLEFCTLHLQLNSDLDSIVANSVFADGVAAALISKHTPPSGKKVLRLDSFASALLTEGAEDMAWTIGDRGFDIVLSKYVPKIIASNIHSLVQNIVKQNGAEIEDISHWAVHPGGKSILDKVQSSLGIENHQIAASRNTLRDFGNMSSATVLFVLQELLKTPDAETLCAIAFGPGLSVESALLGVHSH